MIGQIGVVTDTMRSTCVRWGLCRNGVGVAMVASYFRRLYKNAGRGFQRFALDVETANRNALSLYQSCGFQESNVYDYYIVPL